MRARTRRSAPAVPLGMALASVAACHRWRVHTRWWTDEEIWRDYWEVTTDTGLLSTLYYDRLSEAWYLERVYE